MEKFDDFILGDYIVINCVVGYEYYVIVIEVYFSLEDNIWGFFRVIYCSVYVKIVVKGILLCMIIIG